jgi:hypothetical protein
MKKLSVALAAVMALSPLAALPQSIPPISTSGSLGYLGNTLTLQNVAGQNQCSVVMTGNLVGTIQFLYANSSRTVGPNPLANPQSVAISGAYQQNFMLPSGATSTAVTVSAYTSGDDAIDISCSYVPVAQFVTTTGNSANTGAITATNLNPYFISSATPFTFSPDTVGTVLNYTIQTNLSLLGAIVNPSANVTGFATIGITGFSIQCVPYNSALLTIPSYPYTAETNGIAGGTVTFHEYKPTGAAVVVGTLVLPTSPHGGPYINTVSTRLSSPYIPTAGSTFDAALTSANPTPSNYYQGCTLQATLQ